jgi:hypothetical protein
MTPLEWYLIFLGHAHTRQHGYPHGHGTYLDKDQDMTPDERRLTRHIAWAVALKLALLAALWWFFVRDDRVSVDAARAAAHLSAPAPPQGRKP